jgi:sialate O-acetylesterase
MMKIRIFILSLFFCSCLSTYSQIRLPKLISDGMILQRETQTRLWGWASPGEKISLKFKDQVYTAVTDQEGRWLFSLSPQKAGGPYEMTFFSTNIITVKNILFGDVWICSGQSNMELTMGRLPDKYPDVISSANNSNIRQFEVPDKYNFKKPDEDVESGQWLPVSPESISKFSGVAYFFADDLYKKYKIPIGLINTALGGSPAEAWISEESLKKFPGYYNEALKFRDKNLITQIESDDRKVSDTWYKILNENDEGLKKSWRNAEVKDTDWDQMTIPGYWSDEKSGNVNGAIWFRKEIEVPHNMIGKPGKLLLGRIVDADSVFINGQFVGTTSYQYPPRRYMFPGNILKEGKNVISIRVINNSGRGGFVQDKPYSIIVDNDSIDLKGLWKYKSGVRMDPLPGQTFIRWKPLGLYNAMIAPLVNFSIKGVIWYQGESNTKNPSEYSYLMRALIEDWRVQWKQGNFPFLFVQLANFMEPKTEPSESNWAELRQAQLQTLAVPKTAMAVTIDLGEWNDIHPLNKKDVGLRLSLAAQRIAYGDKKVMYSGPLFKSMRVKGNKVIIKFSNTGSGLAALNNNVINHFAIAGKDKKFVWAKAKVRGSSLIVWNETITNPVIVRYAWADNPEGANLYNKQGLPASPFEASIEP